MSASPSPSLSSRVRNTAVVVALVAVGLAARSGEQQQTPATPTPDSTAGMDTSLQNRAVADSLAVQDSLAPLQTDSIQPDKFVAAVPASPATWPVDPATGQTLINGRPVVGRVFIMQKVDGLVKYTNPEGVLVNEPRRSLPPIVGASYTPAPIEAQRRHRGIMVQSTLWELDDKRSATRLRYYAPSTPANQLGQ
jgi:hypothetical protein